MLIKHLVFFAQPQCLDAWVRLFIGSALDVGVHGCTCSLSWHSTLGYMGVPVHRVGTQRWGTWVYLFIELALDVRIHECTCLLSWHSTLGYMGVLVH